jgi:hypothetical protein
VATGTGRTRAREKPGCSRRGGIRSTRRFPGLIVLPGRSRTHTVDAKFFTAGEPHTFAIIVNAGSVATSGGESGRPREAKTAPGVMGTGQLRHITATSLVWRYARSRRTLRFGRLSMGRAASYDDEKPAQILPTLYYMGIGAQKLERLESGRLREGLRWMRRDYESPACGVRCSEDSSAALPHHRKLQ